MQVYNLSKKLQEKNMSDCLFCKIIAGEIPGEALYEDKNYYAFNDINPQAPNHFLVIPKKHIAQVSEMSTEDNELIGGLFSVANKICSELSLSDYRLVINNGAGAGQTVFHIHLHVIGGRAMNWPPG